MFDVTLEDNLADALSEIPAEYQEAFRKAIQQELQDNEQQPRTDSDVLAWLRQRRDDFRRGGFIRPDGRPGMVVLSPEALMEQSLPDLLQTGSVDDAVRERRLLLLKIGGFVLAAVLLLLFAMRGRAQRSANREAGTVAVATAGVSSANPTPQLPDITGADESLKTIGSLGGALTIGRPSALELHYAATEELIALPIDPSKPTTRGELRYSPEVMTSDNPVAVWLFGTVLNYAIGIPDSMVRNLRPGDKVTISTDTGATLQFLISDRWQGASHEASRLLSQDRIGVTLFALPAAAEDDVSFAFATYDLTATTTGADVYAVGNNIPFGTTGDPKGNAVGSVSIESATFAHDDVGSLRLSLAGTSTISPNVTTVLLSLSGNAMQTGAAVLPVAADGTWQLTLPLPSVETDTPLFAELRTDLSGEAAVVAIGNIPNLFDQLQIASVVAAWQSVSTDGSPSIVQLSAVIQNPTDSPIYVASDTLSNPPSQGGDAFVPTWQARDPDARLPHLLAPGTTLDLIASVPLSPTQTSIQLQLGSDLWQLSQTDIHSTTATGLAP